MRNETDVCRGVFWVICLIPELIGGERIKRLKQPFFLLLSTYLHLFPPPDVKMLRNSCGLCLIFSPSGFSFRLNPYFDYVKSRIPSYTIIGMQKYTFLRWHSTPMTFCSLVSYVWPWNKQMKPREVKVSSEMHWPQDMDSGDIQVWLFSAHALTRMCVL